ncbi:MAG: phage gp6-like head-tail connector protein [Microbacteriaceae bacterium]|nr:phage gp6-like head-tail connector protein [Microbacteriaceae bacterium]
MALTTTAEYKSYAGISGSTDDTFIGLILAAAQTQVAQICNRTFESATVTEIYDGNGEQSIVLRRPPVTSVTSVEWATSSTTWTTLPSEAYRIDLNAGVLSMANANASFLNFDDSMIDRPYRIGVRPSFPRGNQNVRVVYVGGYATIPDDLKFVVWSMMDMMFADRRANKAMQSESIGAYSYSRVLGSDMRAHWESMLGSYVLRSGR